MKPSILAGAALAGMLLSSAASAESDCTDPVADWQPRETLRDRLEQQGWTVQRIKADDGCYEVRGMDSHGNKLKGKYSPRSLRIKKLEIEFSDEVDATESIDHRHN